MTRSKFFLSTMIVGLSLLAAPVLAQDKAKDKPAEKPVESVVKKKAPAAPAAIAGQPTGPVKDWIDAENAMIDPLSQKDQESVFILRNKYSIIRVIGIVERDIGNAVKSCGDKNPGMKKQMDDRYKQWKNSVNPIITTAKKQLDKDIDAQKMVDVDQFRKVLKLNDKAYEFGDKQTTKTPVTTPEACKGLLSSMDRTEDEMITLLRQTLLPEDVIRKRGIEAEKKIQQGEEAAKKKAAAAKAEKDAAKTETAPANKKSAE